MTRARRNVECQSIILQRKPKILYCPLGEEPTPPSAISAFGHITPADTGLKKKRTHQTTEYKNTINK